MTCLVIPCDNLDNANLELERDGVTVTGEEAKEGEVVVITPGLDLDLVEVSRSFLV